MCSSLITLYEPRSMGWGSDPPFKRAATRVGPSCLSARCEIFMPFRDAGRGTCPSWTACGRLSSSVSRDGSTCGMLGYVVNGTGVCAHVASLFGTEAVDGCADSGVSAAILAPVE